MILRLYLHQYCEAVLPNTKLLILIVRALVRSIGIPEGCQFLSRNYPLITERTLWGTYNPNISTQGRLYRPTQLSA